jgi:4-amino-4-deoxy-L-arabinose transferase-like glycosyltransferase
VTEAPARRDWLVLGGLFLFAFAIRLAYLYEIREMPFLLTPVVDALAYDEWAQRIAAGDWWGDRVFYQAPAYPYLLAVFYELFGRDLWLVHVLQMAMGAGSCVLMAGATGLIFGRSAGLVAGAGLALYPPAIFFDGLLGKTVLDLLLTSGLLCLLAAFQRSRRGGLLVAAGCVLGLLALTRENTLVFVAALPFWLWLRFADASRRRRAGWLLAFGLGVALLLLPVGARNYAVGRTFALTTAQLGPNFYMGNNAEATGLYVPLIPGRHTPLYEAGDAELLAERALGRPLTRGEVSDYWLQRGLDFAREHPLRWLALLAWKLALTWNEFEIADVEDIHVYAEWSLLLRAGLQFLHFGLLAPLAILGGVLLWPRRRDFWLLPWLALVYSLSVALFITFARFRFPLVPILLPLAAVACVRALDLSKSGRWAELRAPGLVFAACLVCFNLPLLDEERQRLTSYTNLGGIMLNQDRLAEAEPYLARALAADADNADLLFHLAVLRYKQGRHAEAEAELARMFALEPRDHRGHRLLARIYRETGRSEQAQREARIAAELDPEPAARPARRPAARP